MLYKQVVTRVTVLIYSYNLSFKLYAISSTILLWWVHRSNIFDLHRRLSGPTVRQRCFILLSHFWEKTCEKVYRFNAIFSNVFSTCTRSQSFTIWNFIKKWQLFENVWNLDNSCEKTYGKIYLFMTFSKFLSISTLSQSLTISKFLTVYQTIRIISICKHKINTSVVRFDDEIIKPYTFSRSFSVLSMFTLFWQSFFQIVQLFLLFFQSTWMLTKICLTLLCLIGLPPVHPSNLWSYLYFFGDDISGHITFLFT